MIEYATSPAGVRYCTRKASRRRIVQPAWMADVCIGDVLISGRGTERIVRDVMRYRDGVLGSVTFAIRRCSWTHRCYTVLNDTDLRCQGYRPANAHAKLRTKLDRQIAAAICERGGTIRALDCCDVKGIA